MFQFVEGSTCKLVDIKSTHSKPTKTFNGNNTIKNVVHFMNKQDRQVGQTELTGVAGTKIKVQAPQGFALASKLWDFIILSTSEPDQKIYVDALKQASPLQQGTASLLTNYTIVHGHVTTYSEKHAIAVYDSQLHNIYTVGNNYDCKVIGSGFYDNVRFLQIAQDAWIKATDVFEYQPIDIKIKATSDRAIPIYDCRGRVISRNKLEPNSAWYTDRVVYVANVPYFRVTDVYWLCGNDILEV
ncbi:hypothetical protein [Companilactobacillus furfuricola]|uniref:hypothetical protein n=1 Tax=Companilactobacillus furfuricola TaxID=1462575 RepID=UPI0013DDF9A5|nr:hypothetical protein [Companilactobacillus furfuricola]